MKINALVICFAVATIFAVSFVSATCQNYIGSVTIGQCVQLSSTCDNCTFVNVSSVLFPNKTLSNINQQMANPTPTFYNYTFCNNNNIGEYSYSVFGDLNGATTSTSGCYEVTKDGFILDTGDSIIYFMLVGFVFTLFFLCLFFAIKIPYKNEVDHNTGAVIKITRMKYLKILFVALTYVSFIWVLNVLVGISDNYSTLSYFYGFISFLFSTMVNMTWPFVVFLLVLGFWEIIRDSNRAIDINKFGSYLK